MELAIKIAAGMRIAAFVRFHGNNSYPQYFAYRCVAAAI